MRKLLLLLALCSAVWGQDLWTGIIAPSRAITWSLAGAPHRTDLRTPCVTSACITLLGGTVTASSINAALASAGYNQVVLVPAGTFTIANGIQFPRGGSNSPSCTSNCGNITFRGAGANSTFLNFTNPSGNLYPCDTIDVCMSPVNANGTVPVNGGPIDNISNWTASYTKGTTSITLSARLQGSSAPIVGGVMVLDQLDFINDPEFAVTAVGNASGGNTIYTGDFATCGSSACVGPIVMGGFAQAANNGSFSVVSSNTTTVTVNNASGVSDTIGMAAIASPWMGCQLPSSPVSLSPKCYGAASPGGFTRGGTTRGNMRGQQQIVQVVSVSGTGPYTVVFTPGIYASNWSSAQTPQAWWSAGPVYNLGLENISLNHTASTASDAGVLMYNCFGCWSRGVRSVNTSNTRIVSWSHIATTVCGHCEVRDSYFFGETGTNTDSYGNATFDASDFLEENNIAQKPAPVFFSSADCEGCVSIYNFGVNYFFSGTPAWFQGNMAFHATNMFSLSEGNINNGMFIDSTHGTHVLNTQFRNRWPGMEQNDGFTPSSNTVAARLNPGSRYDNLIGNILGTPGYHTKYLTTPSSLSNLYTSVIAMGDYPEAGSAGQPNPLDPLVFQTAMIWGNYSDCTDGTNCGFVRWCGSGTLPGYCGGVSEVPYLLTAYANPVPASQSLPPSLYYSNRPAYWPANKPWPGIGPDVTLGNVGQCSTGSSYPYAQATDVSQCPGGTLTLSAGGRVTSNPAMDCFLGPMGGTTNGTGGPLAFDPSLCYTTVPNIWPSGIMLAGVK